MPGGNTRIWRQCSALIFLVVFINTGFGYLIKLLPETAQQSPDDGHPHSKASNAVDGRTDPYTKDGSCSHTGPKRIYNPWWLVRMDGVYVVESVELFNRRLTPGLLSNVFVRVGNDSNVQSHAVCGYRTSSVPGSGSANITCRKPLVGSYVSVQIMRHTWLVLCEVKTYGYRVYDTDALVKKVHRQFEQKVKELMTYNGTQCHFTRPSEYASPQCKRLQDAVLLQLFPLAFVYDQKRCNLGQPRIVWTDGATCCQSRITMEQPLRVNVTTYDKGRQSTVTEYDVLELPSLNISQSWDTAECVKPVFSEHCDGQTRNHTCKTHMCKQPVVVWRKSEEKNTCESYMYLCQFEIVKVDNPCYCKCWDII